MEEEKPTGTNNPSCAVVGELEPAEKLKEASSPQFSMFLFGEDILLLHFKFYHSPEERL